MLAGGTVARTAHFALHCTSLDAAVAKPANAGPATVSLVTLFPVMDVWLGAMVPKRWAKRAVTRNAIKRQIYNVSADCQSSLLTAAHVVRLRAGFDRAHFFSATSDELKTAVRQELLQLFANSAARLSATPSRRRIA